MALGRHVLEIPLARHRRTCRFRGTGLFLLGDLPPSLSRFRSWRLGRHVLEIPLARHRRTCRFRGTGLFLLGIFLLFFSFLTRCINGLRGV